MTDHDWAYDVVEQDNDMYASVEFFKNIKTRQHLHRIAQRCGFFKVLDHAMQIVVHEYDEDEHLNLRSEIDGSVRIYAHAAINMQVDDDLMW